MLPGGGIEPGETSEEAAVRELAEECSLSGTVVRHLFDGDHGGRPCVVRPGRRADGEPVLGGAEAEEYSEDNHFQPLWATAGEPLLRLLSRRHRRSRRRGRLAAAGPGDRRPGLARASSGCGSSTSTTSRSSGTAPRMPRASSAAASARTPTVDAATVSAYLARLGGISRAASPWCGGSDGAQRLMGEFFVTRSARGRGLAAAFARQVFARHPGPWAVPFQNDNPRAAAFWRRLAADVLVDVAEESDRRTGQAAPAGRRLAHRGEPRGA